MFERLMRIGRVPTTTEGATDISVSQDCSERPPSLNEDRPVSRLRSGSITVRQTLRMRRHEDRLGSRLHP